MDEAPKFTAAGLIAGSVNGLLILGKFPSPPMYILAGVGTGVAVSMCANRFNQLQSIEQDVLKSMTAKDSAKDSRVFQDRLNHLRFYFIKPS